MESVKLKKINRNSWISLFPKGEPGIRGLLGPTGKPGPKVSISVSFKKKFLSFKKSLTAELQPGGFLSLNARSFKAINRF